MSKRPLPWNQAEDDILRQAYLKNPTRPALGQVSAALGRSLSSVHKRALRLGLSRASNTVAQQQLAATLVSQGYSLSRAAEHLSMSRTQVRHACRRMGVKAAERRATVRKPGLTKGELPPNIVLAIEAVRKGQSIGRSALEHGISVGKLGYYCRRAGVKSPFAQAFGRKGVSE